MNFGSVEPETILRLDNAAWYTKKHGFDYSDYSGDDRREVKNLPRSGNAAVLEYDGEVFFAHSRANDETDLAYQSYVGDLPIVLKPETSRYETHSISADDLVDRSCCTEAKLFEELAVVIDPSYSGEITILSEKCMCESCRGVMHQFSADFPNVTINVVSGKEDYNGSEEGTKTWRYRKR